MSENILDYVGCKLKDTHKNLHRWKNWGNTTEFAPIFDVPIWIQDLEYEYLSDLIYLIKTKNPKDNRKTWKTYNIFDWKHKSLDVLLDLFIQEYKKYVVELEFELKQSLWIRGWAVELESGQGVPNHNHCFHENSYVSGNFMVSNHETSTDYFIPHLSVDNGYYKIQNKPGRLTLFPSWLEHKVDPISSSDRYSIGFDLFTDECYDYAIRNSDKNDPILKAVRVNL
jgi:hypothetical protein